MKEVKGKLEGFENLSGEGCGVRCRSVAGGRFRARGQSLWRLVKCGGEGRGGGGWQQGSEVANGLGKVVCDGLVERREFL